MFYLYVINNLTNLPVKLFEFTSSCHTGRTTLFPVPPLVPMGPQNLVPRVQYKGTRGTEPVDIRGMVPVVAVGTQVVVPMEPVVYQVVVPVVAVFVVQVE